MTKQRNTEEYKLAEQLTGVFTVTCEGCSARDRTECASDDEAAVGFYDDGWRVKRGKVVCRKCGRGKPKPVREREDDRGY